MKRFGLLVVLLAMLAGAACSKSTLSSGTAAMDAPADRACNRVKQLVQARATGTLTTSDLRARASAINDAAQASENPLIRAHAVALFAAATVAVTGGQAPSIDADLAALNNLCSAGGVEAA